MALFKFTKAILNREKIQVFNYGEHRRDFTYIDDIVEELQKALDRSPKGNQNWNGLNPDPGTSLAPWRVYNIGNNTPVQLWDFIKSIEKALELKADVELLPLQPGDVPDTYANVNDLIADFNYKPKTDIQVGVKFVDWYLEYYGEKS